MATKCETYKKDSIKTRKPVKRVGKSNTQDCRFKLPAARISWAKITSTTLTVEMKEGRTLHAPTVALLPVCNLPFRERRRFQVTDDGQALEWPELKYRVTLRQLLGVEE